MAFAAVLVVLVAVNVWVHVGPRRAHLVTGPLAAAVLLLIGRAAGLSWAELGLGAPEFDPSAHERIDVVDPDDDVAADDR